MPLRIRPDYVSTDEGPASATATVAARMLGFHRAPGRNLFPPGLRLIGPRGIYWVFERPARTLRGEHVGPFEVPCPWVVFVVEQFAVRLFARPGPLGRLDDPLFALPLPGVAADGTARFKPNGRQIEAVLARTLQRFEASAWEGLALDPPEGWPVTPGAVLERWAEVPGLAAACALPWRERGPLSAVLEGVVWRSTGALAAIEEASHG